MWTGLNVEHMHARHQVAAQEADEAVCDIDAVLFDPDPTSKSGRSVRVIGYGQSRRAVLTVILVHRDEGGYWARTAGSPAWPAAAGMRRASSR